jgi:hypothetical protein
MDATVIPFPTRPQRATPAMPFHEAGALAQRAPIEEGLPVMEAALGLRRLVHQGVRLSESDERAVLKRCVEAGLRSLTADGADVRLAGTPAHPVLEATFIGEDLESAGLRALLECDDAVRRAGGSEFVISGAAAVGRVVNLSDGVSAISGSPGWAVDRLAQKAAPGQVLLGGVEWAFGHRITVRPAADLEAPSGAIPVFVLKGLR